MERAARGNAPPSREIAKRDSLAIATGTQAGPFWFNPL